MTKNIGCGAAFLLLLACGSIVGLIQSLTDKNLDLNNAGDLAYFTGGFFYQFYVWDLQFEPLSRDAMKTAIKNYLRV